MDTGRNFVELRPEVKKESLSYDRGNSRTRVRGEKDYLKLEFTGPGCSAD
jgi:hypothetical protein